jgi:hypothetical protein
MVMFLKSLQKTDRISQGKPKKPEKKRKRNPAE